MQVDRQNEHSNERHFHAISVSIHLDRLDPDVRCQPIRSHDKWLDLIWLSSNCACLHPPSLSTKSVFLSHGATKGSLSESNHGGREHRRRHLQCDLVTDWKMVQLLYCLQMPIVCSARKSQIHYFVQSCNIYNVYAMQNVHSNGHISHRKVFPLVVNDTGGVDKVKCGRLTIGLGVPGISSPSHTLSWYPFTTATPPPPSRYPEI